MSAHTDEQIMKALRAIGNNTHEMVKVLDALNTNLIAGIKAMKGFTPSAEQAAIERMLWFSPNQVVRIVGTDSFGKVTVTNVEGVDLLPKIEVEMFGSGEKVLFAPEQLETEGTQHGEKRS